MLPLYGQDARFPKSCQEARNSPGAGDSSHASGRSFWETAKAQPVSPYTAPSSAAWIRGWQCRGWGWQGPLPLPSPGLHPPPATKADGKQHGKGLLTILSVPAPRVHTGSREAALTRAPPGAQSTCAPLSHPAEGFCAQLWHTHQVTSLLDRDAEVGHRRSPGLPSVASTGGSPQITSPCPQPSFPCQSLVHTATPAEAALTPQAGAHTASHTCPDPQEWVPCHHLPGFTFPVRPCSELRPSFSAGREPQGQADAQHCPLRTPPHPRHPPAPLPMSGGPRTHSSAAHTASVGTQAQRDLAAASLGLRQGCG